MAVVVNQNAGVIELNAAGDEIAMPIWVKSVRYVSTAGTTATDVITLVDPQATSEVLWTTFGFATEATEAELIEKMWHNGFRLDVNTGNNGRVFISYK